MIETGCEGRMSCGQVEIQIRFGIAAAAREGLMAIAKVEGETGRPGATYTRCVFGCQVCGICISSIIPTGEKSGLIDKTTFCEMEPRQHGRPGA